MKRETEAVEKRTCILVLGMHRSGTSALTKLLNIAGAALPQNLLGPGNGNEVGHWESDILVHYHETMLAEMRSSWSDWQALDVEALPVKRREEIKEGIREIIEAEYGRASLFVVKDPRICRFAPLFVETLNDANIDVHIALTFRNPLEVCESLEKRNGMKRADAALLWLRHVLDAEVATRNETRTIFFFDQLLSDWRPNFYKLSEQMAINWPVNIESITEEVDNFLNPALRHYTKTAEDLRLLNLLQSCLHETWQALLDLEKSPSSSAPLQRLDGVRKALNNAVLFSNKFLTGHDDNNPNHKNGLSDTLIQTSDLSAHLVEKEHEIVHLRQNLDDKKTELADVHAQLIGYNTQFQALKANVDNIHLPIVERHEKPEFPFQVVSGLFIRTSRVLLRPMFDLEFVSREADAITWKMTGTDPQFDLEFLGQRTLAPGHYQLLINFPDGWSKLKKTNLYFNTGQGYNQEESTFLLFEPYKEGWAVASFYLNATTNSIRFDPSAAPGEISIGKVHLRTLSRISYYAGVLKNLIAGNKQGVSGLFKRTGKALGLLARSGPRGLASVLRVAENMRLDNINRSSNFGQNYNRWISEFEEISADERNRIRNEVESFEFAPIISIVMPVYNTPQEWLVRVLETVQQQLYPNWELCICDDCSSEPHIKAILDDFQKKDERIKVVYRETNGHISTATNDAMALAKGEYMVLIDHDDEISENALYEFVKVLNEDRTVDFIYSDEDKLSTDNKRYEPFFKPDWSPELLESCMYTAHLACYDMRIVKKIGGFRPECNGAQDYDFVLRYTEHVKNVYHVPKILYHWRAIPGSTAQSMDNKDYVIKAAVNALEERVSRTGELDWVRPGMWKGSFEVRRKVKNNPLVSIVIPTAGRCSTIRGKSLDLLVNCIESIEEHSTYKNIEYIVVDNCDLTQDTKSRLSHINIKYVHYKKPIFNVAEKMNVGAAEAKGEFLLFLNDDIEVISPDWLEAMLSIMQIEGVGCVGAKLYFEDRSLQHVGVTFCGGLPDHIRRGYPENDPGYFFSSVTSKNYMAVTGACVMVPRKLFEEVGGFDELFAVNYNDIDLCLKIYQLGYRIVMAPQAHLFHFESQNRVREVNVFELERFLELWGEFVCLDPYYGVNFEKMPPTFELDL